MNKIRIAIVLIMLFVLGIALTVSGISNLIKLNGYVPDFNYESMQSIKKGDFVQGYVENIYDCYANETTTESTMGIETSSRTSEEYFIMPLLSEEDIENDLYITVSAGKFEDRQLLYEIRNRTWDYMQGGSDENWPEMGIVAKVEDIDPELLQYMTEWFRETAWFDEDENNKASDAEIQKHIVHYELVIYNVKGAYIGLVAGLIIIALFAVAGVIAYRRLRPAPLSGETGSFPAYAPNEAADVPARAAQGGFSEAYKPPEPLRVDDIPQPLQPDEFFARPAKKSEASEKAADTAAAAAAEEKPPVQTAAYGDMDVLDTSALNMDSLDSPEDSSGEYEFTE